MKKEDILELSKKENKNGDEREKHITDKAYAIGGSIGLLLCAIVGIIEEIFFDRSTTTIWLIYTGMYFSISLISYLRSKSKLWLVLSIIFGICFTLYAVIYAFEIVGVM